MHVIFRLHSQLASYLPELRGCLITDAVGVGKERKGKEGRSVLVLRTMIPIFTWPEKMPRKIKGI